MPCEVGSTSACGGVNGVSERFSILPIAQSQSWEGESGLDWGLWARRVSGGGAQLRSWVSREGMVAGMVQGRSCGRIGKAVGARCKLQKRKQDHVNAETGEEVAERQGTSLSSYVLWVPIKHQVTVFFKVLCI